MSKNKELAKNTLIIGIGRIFGQLTFLILLPLYTAHLSTQEYGLADLITTYTTLLASVVTLQLEMAAFRYLIDSRGKDEIKAKVISSVFITVTILSVIFAVLSMLILMRFKVKYGSLIVANIFSMIFMNLMLQTARGLGKNVIYAVTSSINSLAILVGSYIMVAQRNQGVRGILLSVIAANILCMIYLFWSLNIIGALRVKNYDKHLAREALRFSLPMVPNSVSWWVISVSDRSILTVFLGIAATGIYAVSAKYTLIFTSLSSIFSMALIESISAHLKSDSDGSYISDINNMSIKLFGSIGLGLIAVCPFVFQFLIGRDFQDAAKYVPILIVGAFVNSIISTYSAVYFAKKMTKKVATTTIIAAIVNISLTLAFVKPLGLYAAALATPVAYIVMALFRHRDLKNIIQIKYEKNLMTKMILAYAVIITIFYLNLEALNIANTGLACIAFVMFNKQILISSKTTLQKFLHER